MKPLLYFCFLQHVLYVIIHRLFSCAPQSLQEQVQHVLWLSRTVDTSTLHVLTFWVNTSVCPLSSIISSSSSVTLVPAEERNRNQMSLMLTNAERHEESADDRTLMVYSLILSCLCIRSTLRSLYWAWMVLQWPISSTNSLDRTPCCREETITVLQFI